MRREWATTHAQIDYDDGGWFPERVPDPEPPSGDGWRLVAASVGPLRLSCMAIFWSWEREVDLAPVVQPA